MEPLDKHHPTSSSLVISAESIYDGSPVTIEARALTELQLRLSGNAIGFGPGCVGVGDGSAWRSELHDGAHVVRVEVLGWIRERPVAESGEGTSEQYGMRYYPFVSSVVSGTVDLEVGAIDTVDLHLPDEIRVMWFQSSVQFDDRRVEPVHAYGATDSRWIYRDDKSAKTRVNLDLGARLGGAQLARIVDFPLYYWVLSLAGLVIAARAADNATVLVTAVGALWTVMLRQWSSSRLPQQNTLLTAAYAAAATGAAVWAVLWEVSLVAGLVAVVPFLAATIAALRARRQFARRGTLPAWIVRPWRLVVRARVRGDREAGSSLEA